jgi:hypothetical protein
MKKLFLIASLFMTLTGMTYAQTTAPKKAKDAKTTTAAVKPAATTTAKPATAAGPTKKDGTPDMRYKANKDAAKTPPQHLKKDGTPDMRYKENKEAAKAKKS